MEIREEESRPNRAFVGEVGPWRLRVFRGSTSGMLCLYVSRRYEDFSDVSITVVDDVPSAAIASAETKFGPLAGDLAGDIADGLGLLIEALEVAEMPPPAPAADPIDQRMQVGPTDV